MYVIVRTSKTHLPAVAGKTETGEDTITHRRTTGERHGTGIHSRASFYEYVADKCTQGGFIPRSRVTDVPGQLEGINPAAFCVIREDLLSEGKQGTASRPPELHTSPCCTLLEE